MKASHAAVGLVAASVLGLGVYLVYGSLTVPASSASKRALPKETTGELAASANRPAHVPRIHAPTSDGPQPVDDVGATELAAPASDPAVETLAQLIADEAPRELTYVGAACYSGEPSNEGKLEFSYRLQVESGNARASDIRIVNSTLGNPALERCLVTKLADHKWAAAGAADHDKVERAEISVTGLSKVARRLAPAEESQEEEDDDVDDE